MSILSKNIFIVNCELEKFELVFSRKRNSDIINHHEIKQRLTNNDVFKIPPSDEVVEFQIVKKLNSFRKCKKTEFLFFYVDSIEKKFIQNLKDIFTNCEFPVNYHLLIDSELPSTRIHKEFNSVQNLEND
jgi:hypothetical protein